MREPREGPGIQTWYPLNSQLTQGQLLSLGIYGTAAVLSTLRVAQWGVQSGVPSAFSPQEAGSPASEIGCTQKEKWTQGESVT